MVDNFVTFAIELFVSVRTSACFDTNLRELSSTHHTDFFVVQSAVPVHDGADVSLKMLLESRRPFEEMISSALDQVAGFITMVSQGDWDVGRQGSLHSHARSRPVGKAIDKGDNVRHVLSEIVSVYRRSDAHPRVVRQSRAAVVNMSRLFFLVSGKERNGTGIKTRCHQFPSLSRVRAFGQDSFSKETQQFIKFEVQYFFE